jgi:hypothetical protein
MRMSARLAPGDTWTSSIMGAMKQLSGEERWAQACIQQALPGSQVEQHDDGSKPSMYDLKILYPDDTVGAVEVTAAADAEQIELWKLVGGRGKRWIDSSLAGGWLVRILPSTRARVLHEQLPDLLRELESRGVRAVRGNRSSGDQFTAKAGELRIVEARQGATAYPGSIYVMIDQPLERMGGFLPATGDPLAAWLGEWLADPSRQDNLYKLMCSGACERHIFVLVPGFTSAPFAITHLLIDSGAPLPTIAPALPSGITHVWAMSMWDTGDGFRWSPDNGWERFTKVMTVS